MQLSPVLPAWAALFLKLIGTPSATDDNPGSWLHCCSGLSDTTQRAGERRHAHPVHFGTDRQACANCVEVRIDESGNDSAALEVDDSSGRSGCLPDVSRSSEGQYPPVVDG